MQDEANTFFIFLGKIHSLYYPDKNISNLLARPSPFLLFFFNKTKFINMQIIYS